MPPPSWGGGIIIEFLERDAVVTSEAHTAIINITRLHTLWKRKARVLLCCTAVLGKKSTVALLMAIINNSAADVFQ